MKKYFVHSIIVFGLVCFFSAFAQAGNRTSSSSNGTVVAIILCEHDEAIAVDHSQVTINTDTCNCTAYDDANEDVGCLTEEDDNSCPTCLASLQRGGLTIVSSNGFLDADERKSHYLLTGNGTPFETRFGCYCD